MEIMIDRQKFNNFIEDFARDCFNTIPGFYVRRNSTKLATTAAFGSTGISQSGRPGIWRTVGERTQGHTDSIL